MISVIVMKFLKHLYLGEILCQKYENSMSILNLSGWLIDHGPLHMRNVAFVPPFIMRLEHLIAIITSSHSFLSKIRLSNLY